MKASSVVRYTAKDHLAPEKLGEVEVAEVGRDAEVCRELGHGRAGRVL